MEYARLVGDFQHCVRALQQLCDGGTDAAVETLHLEGGCTRALRSYAGMAWEEVSPPYLPQNDPQNSSHAILYSCPYPCPLTPNPDPIPLPLPLYPYPYHDSSARSRRSGRSCRRC